MSTRGLLRVVAVTLSLQGGWAGPLHAQLLSPGRLATAHQELEGLRNCTSCHELGQRGISPERCLSCHAELEARIAQSRGYHATVPPNTCADCHRDHFGAGFDVRRLDEGAFDHRDTGYQLRLSHVDVDCRDCHRAALVADPQVVGIMSERGALDRTFLGLSTECARCHVADSPHGDQFGARGCVDCHDEGVWETPPTFDHEATSFPLEGRHAEVACSDCHGEAEQAVYRPLAYAACSDCHTDPHSGVMGATCTSCHSTTGWTDISGNVEGVFNHSSTRFPLEGAHATLQCGTCHVSGRPPRSATLDMTYVPGTQGSTYPRPLFDTCRACHVEQHASAAGQVRWTDCESCHSNTQWAPTPFDVPRHSESTFPLTGAHVVTPCVSCHMNPELGHDSFTLELPGQTCVDCHRGDDPHGDLYIGTPCSECHDTEDFRAAVFDHGRVLSGPSPQACASCHGDDDPHQGQFPEQDCATCHATEAFTIESFDHDATSFPLDGAHAPAPCASCHRTEPGPPAFVRYRPLGTDCVDCHTGGV